MFGWGTLPNRVMARGEVVTTFDPCTDSELTIVGKLLCVTHSEPQAGFHSIGSCVFLKRVEVPMSDKQEVLRAAYGGNTSPTRSLIIKRVLVGKRA